MNRILCPLLCFAALTANPSFAEDYSGKVGKLEAVFSLDWHEDGRVSGRYSYPSRPGVSYTLEGTNPAEGELYLAEYTGKRLTARCQLSKRLEKGRIVWEGMMANTDGRRFPMAFSRQRRNETTPPAADDYEAERDAFLAAMAPEVRWDDFPKADEPVTMVPVHVEEGRYFGARVEELRFGPGSTTLVLAVADWDEEGDLELDSARRITVHAARALPLSADRLTGCLIPVLFASDGSLFSLELADLAVTHARRHESGKFEVRGILDYYVPGVRPEFGTPEYEAEMRRAPVAEFRPDKIALDHLPGAVTDWEDGYGFQTIRLVRGYGICVQSTAAGPGSVELESISLEPEANPWIPLRDARVPIQAPPSQSTGQAG